MEQKVNVNNNEISVERIISLEKQNLQLSQQVGELRSDKQNLEDKIKEGQKEVKIIKGSKQPYRYGDGYEFVTESIETRNLGDIEEIVRKKYQSDIDAKNNEVKKLTDEIEDLRHKNNRIRITLENEYADYRTELNIEHDKTVKKLRDEIKKLKEDKTDEQLIAARAEEINNLKNEVKELKKVIKDMQSLNPFKVLWTKLTKKIVITDNAYNTYSGNTHKTVYDTLYDIYRKIKI